MLVVSLIRRCFLLFVRLVFFVPLFFLLQTRGCLVRPVPTRLQRLSVYGLLLRSVKLW